MVDSMKGAVIADGRVSYSDFRMPTPGHGHDLVRVLAAALTNLDVITAEGRRNVSTKMRQPDREIRLAQ
jgi:NADPH:quinone reductase-like Zn-dependent oxidoreductase